MGAFWRRLLTVERRLEYYRRTIANLQITITSLEQQLAQLQGNV
jgi:CII-binding regulator of phage lambda lysogenization HflD